MNRTWADVRCFGTAQVSFHAFAQGWTVFNKTVRDGGTPSVKGPWSESSGMMQFAAVLHCAE